MHQLTTAVVTIVAQVQCSILDCSNYCSTYATLHRTQWLGLGSVINDLFSIRHTCYFGNIDAVFSGELTGSADCSQDGSQYIQRLPYFLLVNRLKDSYAESENTMKAEMKHIQDALVSDDIIITFCIIFVIVHCYCSFSVVKYH